MTTAPRPRATAAANLTCPLCGWALDSEVDRMTKPDNLAAAPGVARALGVPTGALLSIHQNAARRRDEHAIERHMSTHGPADWLPALTAALSATHHLELATTSAAERTKIIDQAALIAQMGGLSDDMLVALLTLAAARAMTPNVEAKLREQGIEPDPRRVQERVDEARRDPRVREAIESISVSYDDVQTVAAAGKTLPPRGEQSEEDDHPSAYGPPDRHGGSRETCRVCPPLDRPAPVVPDSPDVRSLTDLIETAMTDDGHRMPRAAETRYLAHVAAQTALAVVGQGVTAEQREQAVASLYRMFEAAKAVKGARRAGKTALSRDLQAILAVVRPSGQEGS